MKNFKSVLFLFFIVFFNLVIKNCFAEKRIAFLIGNANYSDSSLNLKSPKNDVEDLGEKLEQCNFRIIKKYDLNQGELENEINLFVKAAESYDVVLFYYSGHGVELNSGTFIVPNEIDLKLDINSQLYSLNNIEEKFYELNKKFDNKKLLISIFDACRDNPFPQTKSIRIIPKIEFEKNNKQFKPINSLTCYAVPSGEQALDGYGLNRNSLFTGILINNILKEGIPISELFVEVRGELYRNDKVRINSEYSSLLSDYSKFCFNGVFKNNYHNECSIFDLKNVNTLLENEDSIAAFNILNKCRYSENITDSLLFYLGEFYLKGIESILPDTTKAINIFNQAIEINNKNPLGYMYLGLIFWNQNLYESSYSNFEKSAELGSSDGLFCKALFLEFYCNKVLGEKLLKLQQSETDFYKSPAIENDVNKNTLLDANQLIINAENEIKEIRKKLRNIAFSDYVIGADSLHEGSLIRTIKGLATGDDLFQKNQDLACKYISYFKEQFGESDYDFEISEAILKCK